jgi:hypothetical protein
MFICLQLNDYKHLKRARPGRVSYTRAGKQGTIYRVMLNSQGQPIWDVLDWKAYYAAGFPSTDRFGGDSGRVRTRLTKQYPGIPWLTSPAHRKLVTMAEAAMLVDPDPPASLDRLTEILQDAPELAQDRSVIQNYIAPAPVKPRRARVKRS